MLDEKAVYIDELQLIDILRELNLPTWAYHRKLLKVLIKSEGSFSITELIDKTSLPWRKTYEVVRDFMQIGLYMMFHTSFQRTGRFIRSLKGEISGFETIYLRKERCLCGIHSITRLLFII